jgi:hypothetical protein
MTQDAKDHLDAELRKAPVNVEVRERLSVEYTKAMTNIRNLVEEEFQLELQRERKERRWVAGGKMDPKWNEALKREQDVMDNIKAQKESSSLVHESSYSRKRNELSSPEGKFILDGVEVLK